ncbi:Right handed beta helix region [Nonlabens sp. Hel1_33_55]|uniref:right-handed parallel beta-helix repeat-containing protein n=1 Tax=Nonlabens sp. Hel1_33_55 TaxID=1336802 RepID=UPI000875EAFA|nr:Ig-like domain-containing protein [Nonlabens sp. Hel1_33_55]SCY41578.1 Right handed beta helix region [Nonlabens sp. Hel1_33_55]
MKSLELVLLLVLFVGNAFTTVRCSNTDDIDGLISEDNIIAETILIYGDDITNGTNNQLVVGFVPNNTTNQMVSWSSSDTQVATITENGVLQPVTNGTVTVTVTAQDGSNVSGSKTFSISGVTQTINGTVVSNSQEIIDAIANATAGEEIFVRGGTYAFVSTLEMNASGTSGSLIKFQAFPDDTERPRFDFSAMGEDSSNRGIDLNGDFWHIKGIDVFGAGDNGMHIAGNNNTVEFSTFSENADTGLQIDSGGSNNFILNCDSFFNADSTLENADGFACKLDAGSGNRFKGCRAWQNLDDGWDGYLRNTTNITTTHEDCWAIRNGVLRDGSVGAGDGNGFKTGGSDNKDLIHNAIYNNCVAVGNTEDGFDHNSNRGDVVIYNGSSYDNKRNYSFSNTNPAASLIVKNSLSFDGSESDSFNATQTDITNNGFQDGRVTNSSDFRSLNVSLMLSARQANGDLPVVDFLRLTSSSDLIDAGVDVGLPFNGTAPDIGAFEFEQ